MNYLCAFGICLGVILTPWAMPVAHAGSRGKFSVPLPALHSVSPRFSPAQNSPFYGMRPVSRLLQRIKFAWPGENDHIWHTPILLPTMQPDAPPPLVFDLTPLIPCPDTEYRRWDSFGEMPAIDLIAASWWGYSQASLCTPLPWLYMGHYHNRIVFYDRLNGPIYIGALAAHRNQASPVPGKRSRPRLGFKARGVFNSSANIEPRRFHPRPIRNRCLARKACTGMNLRLRMSASHRRDHFTSPYLRAAPHIGTRHFGSNQRLHFTRRTHSHNLFSRPRQLALSGIGGRQASAFSRKHSHPGMRTRNDPSPSNKSKENFSAPRARPAMRHKGPPRHGRSSNNR